MCVQFTLKKSCAQQRLSISIKLDNRPNIVSIVNDHHVSGDIYTETPWMQNGTIRTRLGCRNHLDISEPVKRLV